VDGVIFCRKLTVLGSVRADVICDNVLVRNGGRLSAALKYRTIKIEPGGMVGGKFQRRVTIDGQASTPAAGAGIPRAV
jgi:cytoskeletal protein CcmA (bactofilin family)